MRNEQNVKHITEVRLSLPTLTTLSDPRLCSSTLSWPIASLKPSLKSPRGNEWKSKSVEQIESSEPSRAMDPPAQEDSPRLEN